MARRIRRRAHTCLLRRLRHRLPQRRLHRTQRLHLFPQLRNAPRRQSISGGNTIKGPFEWAGTGDQYFTAIFIPDDPAASAMVTLRNPMEIAAETRPQSDRRQFQRHCQRRSPRRGRRQSSRPTTERMYVGPKELAVLDAVPVPTIKNDNPDLRGIVNFGWWGILPRPLFLWLKWTYNHIVHNWGWAIVIQTFIITVAAAPAAHHADEVDAEDAAHRSPRSRTFRRNTRSTACATRAKPP